jgi:EYS protein
VFDISDLEIGQPSFFSSVGGLASYAAYPIPGAIHNSMELKFKFIPSTVEQIALMVFVGQDGFHDSRADHLSVSFIKGYVVLTWNLGSGIILDGFQNRIHYFLHIFICDVFSFINDYFTVYYLFQSTLPI